MTDDPKPGRHKRTQVDVLRTKLWVRGVMRASGLRTGYALEAHLEPELLVPGADGINRPKKWDAYVKGTRSPLGRAGRPPATEIAETRYPGTRRVFDSVAWRFLSGKSLTAEEADAGIYALGPEVTRVIYGTRGLAAKRQPVFNDRRLLQLSELASLEAMLAAVLLAAKAEALMSLPLRSNAAGALGLTCLNLTQLWHDIPLDEYASALDVRCAVWSRDANQEVIYATTAANGPIRMLGLISEDPVWFETELVEFKAKHAKLKRTPKAPPRVERQEG